MGNGDKSFHNIVAHRHINQQSLGDKLADLAFNFCINRKLRIQAFPWIWNKLFHSQGYTVLSAVYRQDYCFHVLIFTIHFSGVIDALCPAYVRYMNKAIYAFFNFYKSTKGSKAFYLSGKHGTHRVTIFNG